MPTRSQAGVNPFLVRSFSLITTPHRWCIDKESRVPVIKAGITNMLTTHGPSSHRRKASAILTHPEILVSSVYLPKGMFLVTNF
jgi:hypothetical protein